MNRIKYWVACAAKFPVVRSEVEKEGNRKIVEMLQIYIKNKSDTLIHVTPTFLFISHYQNLKSTHAHTHTHIRIHW